MHSECQIIKNMKKNSLGTINQKVFCIYLDSLIKKQQPLCPQMNPAFFHSGKVAIGVKRHLVQ